ncbi:g3455 [Coccomyxa viridis]|uniref:tRNA-specific adenosine deaminase 2 n=1 Tax=Coccomyxa viridis TaxID=1274662 RepID=A0ABP1FMV0_9CHLO
MRAPPTCLLSQRILQGAVIRSRAVCHAVAAEEVFMQGEADKVFMTIALDEARQGAANGEVPVGAVLVRDSNILVRAHNLVEQHGDPTAHAEMVVIRQAAAQGLGRWDLQEATLYVTLEPCAMCAGAILISRVGTVVYGARSTLLGADGTWMQLFPCQHDSESSAGSGEVLWPGKPHPFHPSLQVRRGVLAEESGALMKDFFRARRIENDGRSLDAASTGPADNLSATDLGMPET